MKTVFATMEELNQMMGFAEDLESYEYVCKEVLNFYGGTVSSREAIIASVSDSASACTPRSPGRGV